MSGPTAILVTKASATHCRNWENGPEHICAINRTHSDMVKFGPEDHEYEKVLQRLKGLVRRALALRNQTRGLNPNRTWWALDAYPGTFSSRLLWDISSICVIATDNTIEQSYLPSYRIQFPKNKRFVGRNSTLDTLKQMLFVQKECQKVAIVGLGGIGKTQVALQLAHWAKEHQPEHSIFWVPALSFETFEQAYTEMARQLPIQKSNEDEDPKELVRRYLSFETAGKWLLVVDNADEMDVVFRESRPTRRYKQVSSRKRARPNAIYDTFYGNGSIGGG